jgi:hypothetical protein
MPAPSAQEQTERSGPCDRSGPSDCTRRAVGGCGHQRTRMGVDQPNPGFRICAEGGTLHCSRGGRPGRTRQGTIAIHWAVAVEDTRAAVHAGMRGRLAVLSVVGYEFLDGTDSQATRSGEHREPLQDG